MSVDFIVHSTKDSNRNKPFSVIEITFNKRCDHLYFIDNIKSMEESQEKKKLSKYLREYDSTVREFYEQNPELPYHFSKFEIFNENFFAYFQLIY